MKDNSNEKIYKGVLFTVLTAIMLIILIGTNKQCQEDQEIKRFKGVTEAVITKFGHRNLTYYYIEYEYHVNGETYKGRTGIGSFECDDGKLGCVGKKFKLSYSTKDPSKSTIHLGEYEKYKRTVEF